MSDHTAQSNGIVMEVGHFDGEDAANMQLRRVAEKIEDHGEVHGVFNGLDVEIELRLGTVKIDYDANVFEVWDGDTYQTFPVSNLVRVYKPMGVEH